MKRIFLLGCLSAVLVPVAQANVYSCVVNGEKIYTNKKVGNCHSEKLDKIGSYTSDRSIIERQNRLSNEKIAAQRGGNQDSNNNTPAVQQAAAPAVRSRPVVASAPPASRPVSTAPVVANNTPSTPAQSHRDQGRREILMSELTNEKKALAQARLALTNGKLIRNQADARKQQSMSSLQRAVDDRQQNIQALQNELARM
ncbi:hypothetical protein LVJ82_13865 [Vitreoscilla massiliensis]|uniref:DUF4124 domain-containing protein n=1 Tax=Vitreoscilla massiliensis TaxID=1689272 RepID=A0ABY4E186_9NEIS|nr:hypothetical protein [Vitreoscilla massiliensis]UOO88545.1 hypothetical protein LVJ82_13865 [Vitreoscilla massiliensis]